jgi:hypothetical protein
MWKSSKRRGEKMNIELTLTADDGTPVIMDGCSASLTLFDKDKGDVVLFVDGKIIGNKVNYYIKPEVKK